MSDPAQPIIIRRVRKAAKAAHHGGSWKVAYADFVTAMMAFFLVMWLVGAGTRSQKAAIAAYFLNPSMLAGQSQTPAPGVSGPGGASTSMIKLGGDIEVPQLSPDSKQAKHLVLAEERKRMEALMDQLKKAIDQSQAMQPFKDQLLLDITPEGLRIQIVDKQNRPMFDLGGTALKPYTVDILHELAAFINKVPNKISITGHTDITPYSGRTDYSNWELSADRANAARRALIAGSMEDSKVSRVVGLASSVLFDKEDPHNPINRRISIVVMNREAEASAEETERDAGAATSPSTLQADVAAMPAKPNANRGSDSSKPKPRSP